MTDEEQNLEDTPIEPVATQEAEPVEVEPVDEPVEPIAKEWDDETEEEAKFLGWKSPDDWKGDKPPGYIDNPNDFMERLEKSTPFRKMRERAERVEAKTQEELRKITSALEAGHKREMDRQQDQYNTTIAQITARQRKAAEEGDVERFDQLEAAKQNAKPPERQPYQAQAPDRVDAFKADHPWLNDPMLRQAGAQAIDLAMQSGVLNPQSDVGEQVTYAKTQVQKYYPHLFKTDTPVQKPKAKVDGGGLASAKPKSSFDGLPKDARAEFSRQVSKGVFEDTKEDKEFFFNEYKNG